MSAAYRYWRSLQITIVTVLLLSTAISSAYALPAEKPKREERLGWWIEDLEFFARTFPDVQVDFPKLYNPKTFRKEIDQLELAIPRISDSEIILRLMRLVAEGKMAHTEVEPQDDLEFHPYPLQFYWYSDGPALISAKEEYKSALGARLVRIGSMTPEQLEAAVAPFLSHENRPWLHAMSPELMLTREVADHFRLANPDGSIQITFAQRSGNTLQLRIAPSSPATPLISAVEALKLPVPLFRKRPDDWYWYEYLPGSHALYIQYNHCRNDAKKPFKDFAEEVFRFVDGLPAPQKVERVIIDLRSNTGGDSSVIDPLIDGLRSRPQLTRQGHLYAMIGRNTFSSGMMAAVELSRDLHAILIGEPSGSPPNEYGEVQSFTLPNSKLRVRYTTKYFRLLKSSDPPTLEPDVLVPRSIGEVLTGSDRALETALTYPITAEQRSTSK